MAKSTGQKLKLLYIVKLLEENTDEHHPASTEDIITYLEANGIHSQRKSIYDDMEKLCEFGYDIVQVHSRLGGGYYMAGREFELAELKLLVDAVQSSRFITTKKSRCLIKSWSVWQVSMMPASCSVRCMWQGASKRKMKVFITISIPFTGQFRRTGRFPFSIWTGI